MSAGYKRAWGSAEIKEYNTLVGQAMRSTRPGDRARIFLDGVQKAADQAHRPWARDVLADLLCRGSASILRAEERRRPDATVTIRRGDKVVTAPRILGVRRAGPDGHVVYQRTLFDFMETDELQAKLNEFVGGTKTYGDNANVVRRLLALCWKAGAKTPDEAARVLGTTVDEWLGASQRDAA